MTRLLLSIVTILGMVTFAEGWRRVGWRAEGLELAGIVLVTLAEDAKRKVT